MYFETYGIWAGTALLSVAALVNFGGCAHCANLHASFFLTAAPS